MEGAAKLHDMTPLIEQLSEVKHLKLAWGKLNRTNKDSHGMSSETIQEFQNALDSNIADISKLLKTGKYQFQPVRGVVIPKKEKGKYRELRIGDVRDRLVLKAITILLDILLTETYDLDNSFSYAYRKGKNIEQAIQSMVDYYKEGYSVILEADIKKFFGTVNREKLLQDVFKELPDDTLNELVIKGLSQEVGNMEQLTEYQDLFEESLSGIPQGNALSPLLANICLSAFDKRMRNEGYKMIRYADDFIVMCKSRADALKALGVAKEELEVKLGLSIHPLVDAKDKDGKTRIVNPLYDKFSFLSIRFNGNELWVNESKVIKLREAIREVTNVRYSKNALVVFTRTRNLLEGWLSAFKFVDVDRDVKDIDDYVNYQLQQAIRKLGFVLKKDHIAKVKINKDIKEGLTEKQRLNSGVPKCEDFLKGIERNKIIVGASPVSLSTQPSPKKTPRIINAGR